jgi:hypothetical protein
MTKRMLSWLTGIAIGALSGCATQDPQVVQATDCRGATVPCGVVIVDTDHAHAMSNLPVTVPLTPGLP